MASEVTAQLKGKTVMAHSKVRCLGKTRKIQPRRVPQTPKRVTAAGGLEMP